MLTFKNYVRAQSLEEAYLLNQKKRNRVLGGTLWMRLSSLNLDTAIDLCDLGLNTIEETETEFSIGAMTYLRALETHPGLNAYTESAVADAVKDIVGVQFRNGATVGGSIYGRFGFSDVLTVFLTLDCEVELYPSGRLPLAEFARQKRNREILVRLIVKKTPGAFCYSAMRHARTDFPILTCAASCMDGQWRLAVGARPDRAILLTDEQGLLADGVNAKSAATFARFAAERIPTGSNNRGSAEYRTRLVQVLTERTILNVGGRANGD